MSDFALAWFLITGLKSVNFYIYIYGVIDEIINENDYIDMYNKSNWFEMIEIMFFIQQISRS